MKLASIEIIHSFKPIPGADFIEEAIVQAWSCVFKKGLYNHGDKVIFVPIDCLIGRAVWNEFLFKDKTTESFRVKTIRLKQIPSQGIVFPLSILDGTGYSGALEVGEDVAVHIGVTKYEKEVAANIRGLAKGHLPGWLRKSDQENLKSNPNCFEELKEAGSLVFLEKNDGSSTQFYLKNGEFGVCSRSLDLKETSDNIFWQIARAGRFEEKMREKYPDKNFALCGEAIGMKLNGNRLGLKDHRFTLYNVWDIDKQRHLDYDEEIAIAAKLDIETVRLLMGGAMHFKNISEIQEWVNGLTYPNGAPAEGIVIRPVKETYSSTLKGRLSVKLINQNYKD